MDVAILLFGIAVVLFDAYAYSRYVNRKVRRGGGESAELARPSSERALAIKKQFEEDQKNGYPAQAARVRADELLQPVTAPVAAGAGQAEQPFADFFWDAAAVEPGEQDAPAQLDIRVPLKRLEFDFFHQVQPDPREMEMAVLRGELAGLRRKIVSLEKIAYAPVRARVKKVTSEELLAKETELHKMFCKREIDAGTYQAMRAEITKMRLGL